MGLPAAGAERVCIGFILDVFVAEKLQHKSLLPLDDGGRRRPSSRSANVVDTQPGVDPPALVTPALQSASARLLFCSLSLVPPPPDVLPCSRKQ